MYKGFWKGSVVAVKTIVLPALMSGAEKREKMAIMEAAISSALSHPNILQTYTYDIRPLRDTSVGATKLIMGMQSLTTGYGLSGSDDSNAAAGVHSFEVRLVLEYCDRGSLRDALDRGAFRAAGGGSMHLSSSTVGSGGGSQHAGGGSSHGASSSGMDGAGGSSSLSGVLPTPGSVNYRAVLDTAIDIATAMVHLHGRNVLHADLKVSRGRAQG